MRIIFSRKGFDSSAGGGPSPICDGRPVSLPIPGSPGDAESYASLGLGAEAEAASRGRIKARDPAHHDPLFMMRDGNTGPVWFGQAGAAQSHLDAQGIGPGDLFLFFGLFRDSAAMPDHPDRQPHHRIWGWMRVAARHTLPPGTNPPEGAPRHHPHLTGVAAEWRNNTLWQGHGAVARSADPALRLTASGRRASLWAVPSWLAEAGLSYHGNPQRWAVPGMLDAARRGQEFVAGPHPAAGDWAEAVIAACARPTAAPPR